MSPVTTTFSSLLPPPSACVCPTTPRALFLPPHTLAMADKDQQNGYRPLQVSSHCLAPCLLTTHHHHLVPHCWPWWTPTRAKPGCSSHLAPCWLCQPNHAHLASNHVNPPPPCKCNPQINPAPRINHPRQRNWPTKMPQQMESSAEAHRWGPSTTWKTTGDTAPTMQPGAYPVPPH